MGFVVGTGATSPESARGGSGVVTAVTGNSITVAKDANDFVAGEKLVVSQKDASITTWTWSGWVKFSEYSGDSIFGAGIVTDEVTIYFDSDNKFRWITEDGTVLKSAPTFADPAKWTHIVIAVDTTQLIDSDRIKVYIDNERITEFDSASYPTKGYGYAVNKEYTHCMGEDSTSPGNYITDGYMTDINFVDGLQLEPSEFASALSGEWEPKRYNGRYGVFGWNLYGEGDDRATQPETSAIISIGSSASTSVGSPMDNYNILLSDGTYYGGPMTQSQWEELQADPNWNDINPDPNKANGLGPEPYFYVYGTDRCRFQYSGVDTSVEYFMLTDSGSAAMAYTFDLEGDIAPRNGQARQSGNQGRENAQKNTHYFTLTKESGYFDIYLAEGGSLMMKYLSIPTGGAILTFADSTNLDLIAPGSTVEQIGEVIPETPAFSTTVYSGSGNPGQLVETGIDNTIKSLVWIKSIDIDADHSLVDNARPTFAALNSNSNDGESPSIDITSFESNGFFTEHVTGWTNSTTSDYVAWNFRAAPGFFDIVSWTGNGVSGHVIPHNLSTKPNCLIIKSTSNNKDWCVYHTGLERTSANWWENKIWLNLSLEENSIVSSQDLVAEPTDSVFTIGNNDDLNGSGREYVGYLFADTPGKIKCGSYTGNGGTNNVNVGFSPEWLLVKRSTGGDGEWTLVDTSRVGETLWANDSRGELIDSNITLTSTGFTVTTTNSDYNASGDNYVYIAIAEDLVVGSLNPSGEVAAISTTDNTITISNVSGTWEVGGTATGEIAFPGNLDDSGNSNNWTGEGFVEADVVVDSPETHGIDTGVGGEFVSNYATLNPLVSTSGNVTDGGLVMQGSSNWRNTKGTIGVTSGKWYYEATYNGAQYGSGSGNLAAGIGFAKLGVNIPNGDANGNSEVYNNTIAFHQNGYFGNFGTIASVRSQISTGDVIGVSVDMDGGTYEFFHNGASFTSGTLNYSGGIIPWSTAYYASDTFTFNFGATPFIHAAPTDHKCLTTDNLPTSLVPVSTLAFDTVLYNGNGETQKVDDFQFTPDLIWVKSRDKSWNHHLVDTVRGVHSDNVLYTNLSNPAGATDSFSSSTTGGFNVGSNDSVNEKGTKYVAWGWKAGSGATTNVNGSIIASVNANPSAGFSIVSYTGTGANATVGHGLGAPADFILTKNVGASANWVVFHSGAQTTGAKVGLLNTTDPFGTNADVWQDVSPTNTTFSVGSNQKSNQSGNEFISYCWSEVPGFSSFGSYIGNGDDSGPFVYTGFEVAWLLIKRADVAGNDWQLLDAARDPSNPADTNIKPNSSLEEDSHPDYEIDFTSNGFKVRTAHAARNASGGTYVYAAFASKPF